MSTQKSEPVLLGEAAKRIEKLERPAREFLSELFYAGDGIEQASLALQVAKRVADLSPAGVAYIRQELDRPTADELAAAEQEEASAPPIEPAREQEPPPLDAAYEQPAPAA